jgi:hypothetical protein
MLLYSTRPYVIIFGCVCVCMPGVPVLLKSGQEPPEDGRKYGPKHVRTSFLALSNPIFLPTAYSPALICFDRERGWWITCNYPTVLKEKSTEKQKEYNLRYLLAKVRTTWGKASDRLRQQANKSNKNCVGRLPTSERNRKIILSDEVQCRIGKVYNIFKRFKY